MPDLPLHLEEAARALRIFKRLRLPDVIGNPTMGEAFGEWVFDIVLAVFGAYDPATNRRMLQEFFLLVPKKNAKSTLAAGIMVTAAIVNRRPIAEFLLIAPTKEIANIAYQQGAGIIKLDPELSKLFQVQRHIRTITHRQTGALIQIKAADTDVITGSKSTGILVDETHVFAQRANAAAVFVEIRGALAARPDGFMIQITTQSKEPPAGVFRAELAIARDVRDGKVVLPLLPVLYELPADIAGDGGWKRPEFWPLVNPNLGRSVDRAFLERELVKAEISGGPALALLASQHFNVEVGLALRTDAWAGAVHWLPRANPQLSLEALLERCEVVVAGIDGGGLDDLLALCIAGRETGTRRWLAWHRTWADRSVLALRQTEAARLLDFEAAGELVLVDDMPQAFAELAATVALVKDAGLLPEKGAIGLDPAGTGLIVEALVDADVVGEDNGTELMVGIPQGWRLNGAIKTAEVKLKSGEIEHSGQGITAWAVGNAKVVQVGNAITITKQAAGTAKIDPLMAFLDCIALLSTNPPVARRPYQILFVA